MVPKRGLSGLTGVGRARCASGRRAALRADVRERACVGVRRACEGSERAEDEELERDAVCGLKAAGAQR